MIWLADLVLACHVAYVAFVVLGQAAILAGLAWGASWARNPTLRWLHLAMILIVAAEALLGIECPLTRWERDLRLSAGQAGFDLSFTARLMQGLIAGLECCNAVYPIAKDGSGPVKPRLP